MDEGANKKYVLIKSMADRSRNVRALTLAVSTMHNYYRASIALFMIIALTIYSLLVV